MRNRSKIKIFLLQAILSCFCSKIRKSSIPQPSGLGLTKLRVVQNDPYSHITSFTIAKTTKLKINFSLAVQSDEEVISLISIGFVDLNVQ